MKKLSLLTLLTLTSVCLVGCDVGGEKELDPKEIIKLTVSASLPKTHFAIDDEWGISNIKVQSVTRDNTRATLKEDEYTLTLSADSPKDYISTLMLTAKLKGHLKVMGSYTFKNLTVDAPVINSDEEIDEYYKDVDLELSGESLRAELQKKSFNTHKTFIEYGDINSYERRSNTRESVDLVPNYSCNEQFYTGKHVPYSVGTREHVWACNDSSNLWVHGNSSTSSNNVDNSEYIGGGSDLYHIRPVDSTVNTIRGDAPFVDFDDFSSMKNRTNTYNTEDGYAIKTYGGSKNGDHYEFVDYIEVDDNMKGDIARIVAYIYMHYGNASGYTPSGSKYKSMVGNLSLTKVLGYSTTAVCKEKLIEWNQLDPASDVEKYRNHTIMGIQGNRNPFVDYPDLMEKVFGN